MGPSMQGTLLLDLVALPEATPAQSGRLHHCLWMLALLAL